MDVHLLGDQLSLPLYHFLLFFETHTQPYISCFKLIAVFKIQCQVHSTSDTKQSALTQSAFPEIVRC